MVQHFDVTVVGGSFAGLACARAAAERGLRVCLLEARPRADARLRTTGILVREANDLVDLPSGALRTIQGVRLYAPSLESIDLSAPGYAFYATDLPRVMRAQTNEAAFAGVEIRHGAPFRGAERRADRILVAAHDLSTDYLVGADGARSRVARTFGLGVNRQFLVGMEHEYEGVEGIDPGYLHVFVDRALAPGYIGWVVPGPRVSQVGLAVRHPGKLRIDTFRRRVERLFDFSRARRVETRGGLIPVGGRVSRVVQDRVVLTGDAAGTVSPLTAGGIHRALELGPAVGRLIADSVALGLDTASFERHARASLNRQYPRYRLKRLLRHAADRQPADQLVNALFGADSFRAFAQLVFFHHRGLLSRDAWRDLRRLLATDA